MLFNTALCDEDRILAKYIWLNNLHVEGFAVQAGIRNC